MPMQPSGAGSQDPMRGTWESFAQSDAEFYIWTDVAKGDDFFASGQRDAQRILDIAAPYVATRGTALEIGCGVGRLAIPISRQFTRLLAVDISPTMLTKLEANCRSAGIDSVRPFLTDGPWDAQGPVDLAYSHIVFQHIPDWSTIAGYFRRVSGVLAPAGAFYAHFDTRPQTVAYRVKTALPDSVLPRTMRRGVRRIRRTAVQIRDLARSCGLATAHEAGAGTTDTVFVFRRA